MASTFTQGSPGVDFAEIDLTNLPGTVGISGGAFAGSFSWGPVGEITTVSSPLELEQTFHKPTDANFVDWFSAFNFLAYTNDLKISRAIDEATALNSDDTGTGILIKNRQHFEIVNGAPTAVKFAAKYPGALGNSIAVHMADSATFAGWAYANTFESAPGTSTAARLVGAKNDEIHVVVVDAQGMFTGTVGAILESYSFLSKSSDSRDENNAPNYYANVINRTSRYVWALAAPTGAELVDYTTGSVEDVTVTDGGADYTSATVTFSAPGAGGTQATGTVQLAGGEVVGITVTNPGSGYTAAPTVTITGNGTGATATASLGAGDDSSDWGASYVVEGIPSVYKSLATRIETTLSGGNNGETVNSSDLIKAYDLFENQEEVDVSLIFTGHAGGETNHTAVVQHVIDNIAEARRDAIAFFSPKLSDVLNKTQSQATTDVIATRNEVGRSTSYAVMDDGWKLQYDVYNDKYRWVPLNADIAGLCAQVDSTNDPWTSPGGYTRGRLKNVVSLAFNPNKTSRDALFKSGINLVVTFNTDGTVLYSDKTLLGKNSAFSQIGTRRLFITLQKSITAQARFYLFENNNEFTRASFRNSVEPYLQQVLGRGGIEDFRVICDESNNGPQIRMNRQFVGDIFIKPTYSINWVKLNFVAVRQDVAFEEVVGATF